ncbi:unnamed protein product [Caenorhabditis sp. 36 PRJEB53466]|nr:unnamed protein product [Caenorhabditis sp. 36 PRJEB53466]
MRDSDGMLEKTENSNEESEIPIKVERQMWTFIGERLPKLWRQKITPREKIDMIQLLEVPVKFGAQYGLAERDRIKVCVDSKNLVESWEFIYQSPTSSDRSSKTQKTPPSKSRRRKAFTDEEDRQMWLYISNKLKENARIKPKGLSFWQKFVSDTKSDRSPSTLSSHYRKVIAEKLHTVKTMDLNDRMELYYNLHIPIPLGIRINAKVQLGHDITPEPESKMQKRSKEMSPERNLEQNQENSSETPKRRLLRRRLCFSSND